MIFVISDQSNIQRVHLLGIELRFCNLKPRSNHELCFVALCRFGFAHCYVIGLFHFSVTSLESLLTFKVLNCFKYSTLGWLPFGLHVSRTNLKPLGQLYTREAPRLELGSYWSSSVVHIPHRSQGSCFHYAELCPFTYIIVNVSQQRLTHYLQLIVHSL